MLMNSYYDLKDILTAKILFVNSKIKIDITPQSLLFCCFCKTHTSTCAMSYHFEETLNS